MTRFHFLLSIILASTFSALPCGASGKIDWSGVEDERWSKFEIFSITFEPLPGENYQPEKDVFVRNIAQLVLDEEPECIYARGEYERVLAFSHILNRQRVFVFEAFEWENTKLTPAKKYSAVRLASTHWSFGLPKGICYSDLFSNDIVNQLQSLSHESLRDESNMPQILNGRLVGNHIPCTEINNSGALRCDSASFLVRWLNKLNIRRISKKEIEDVLGLRGDDLFYLSEYNIDRILSVTTCLYAVNYEGNLWDENPKLQSENDQKMPINGPVLAILRLKK